MNKRQLTTTIAVLALTLGLFALFMAGRNDRAVRQHIERIGNELISTTNSPHLVFLGPATQSRLATILSSTAVVERVVHRDAPAPIGDGHAAAHIIIKNANGERMGIRLKYDHKLGNYHILGYWTPQ